MKNQVQKVFLLAALAVLGMTMPLSAQDGLDSLLAEPGAVDQPAAANSQPDSRLPVPGAAASKQALSEVKDIFRDEYAGATPPQARLALAKQLLSHADKTAAAVDRWVLYSEAMRLASDAGDVDLCFEAIDAAAEQFAIDAEDLRVDALGKLAAKARPEDLDALARASLAIARKGIDSGDLTRAQRALSLALGFGRKAKNPSSVAEANTLQQSLRDAEKITKEKVAMDSRLAESPGDADVCLEVGKFYCFKAEQWRKGLPLLAKGADTTLARLAVAELNAGRGTEAVISLADGWWTWADEQSGSQKAVARLHAADLYESVLTATEGLDRARLEKRIREANEQKARRREKRIALADLRHEQVSITDFTNDGTYKGKPFTCLNQRWPKGLQASTHAAGVTVTYLLPKGAKKLVGKAGVFTPNALETLNVPPQPGAPIEFEIFVDGRSAWKSPPLAKRDDTADFSVELYGATRVELKTISKSSTSPWSAWLNPEITY